MPSIKLSLIKKHSKALHNETIHIATHGIKTIPRYETKIPFHNKRIQWRAIDGLPQSVYDDEWTKTSRHYHQLNELNGLKNLSPTYRDFTELNQSR